MLPESREERLRCYQNALRNWAVTGYVEFKEIARKWLLDEFPELRLVDVRQELFELVASGGEIDEQVERRPEYSHYEYHFDLRMKIGGRRLYFEAVLVCSDAQDPDDPVIVVVNVHDA